MAAGERLGAWSLCVKPLPGDRQPRRVRVLGSSVRVRCASPRPSRDLRRFKAKESAAFLCAKFRVYTAGGLPKKTGECLLARQAVVGEGIGKPRTSATRT